MVHSNKYAPTMQRGRWLWSRDLLMLLASLAWLGGGALQACPFCNAISSTLTNDLAAARAAVLAECESFEGIDRAGQPEFMTLRVVEVLKGERRELLERPLHTFARRDIRRGDVCLLFGLEPNADAWSAPARLSADAVSYLRELVRLPPVGGDRLPFFLSHLDSGDPLVADDAYNEFAQASLDDLSAIRERIDHAWLLQQLRDDDVPVHHRRLFWTLLAVRGTSDDVAVVEEVLQRKPADHAPEPGLDAAIACYLTLGGERALRRVERDWLANREAEYAETYAAIRAVRVHGTEMEHFSHARLAAALRHVLDRPELADLVIADLARWQDWSVVERLTELFETADEDSRFVKVPVVGYLMDCPEPSAARALERLRTLDPDTVRRAATMLTPGAPDLNPPSLTASLPAPAAEDFVPPPPVTEVSISDQGRRDGANDHAFRRTPRPRNRSATLLAIAIGCGALTVVALLLRPRGKRRASTSRAALSLRSIDPSHTSGDQPS